MNSTDLEDIGKEVAKECVSSGNPVQIPQCLPRNIL